MDTIEYKGFNIQIDYEDSPESPRDWDNLGTMACFHKRYTLGDSGQKRNGKPLVTFKSEDFNSWDEMEAYIKKTYNPLVILSLFLYDHSGLSISTGVHGQHAAWDGGWVGFIFVSKEGVKRNWKVKRIDAKLKKRIEENLLSEVSTYDDYLRGAVYHYSVEDKEGTSLDSCGGFYGYDHEKSGLLEYAQGFIDTHIKIKRRN
jgi:hypothetical protein